MSAEKGPMKDVREKIAAIDIRRAGVLQKGGPPVEGGGISIAP